MKINHSKSKSKSKFDNDAFVCVSLFYTCSQVFFRGGWYFGGDFSGVKTIKSFKNT